MAKILNCTMSILPEFRTEFGNVLNVEVAFSTSEKDFRPEAAIRLVFTKNNASFSPPPGAVSPPGVSKQEPDQYLIKWALHTELLGEGAFEAQAVTGKNNEKITDKPERFFVLQSVAQEIRKVAGGPVTDFETSASAIVQNPEIPVTIKGVTRISGVATTTPKTSDIYLWLAILSTTESLSFKKFDEFVSDLCQPPTDAEGKARFDKINKEFVDKTKPRLRSPFTGGDGYALLKAAAEAFVMVNCGVDTLGEVTGPVTSPNLPLFVSGSDELAKAMNRLSNIQISEGELNALKNGYLELVGEQPQNRLLPYLSVIANRAGADNVLVSKCLENTEPGSEASLGFIYREKPNHTDELLWCYQVICDKLLNPCLLELIWSYWQEEGMLVQTINAIARRFQNIRTPGMRDPLTGLEVSFLRPLNNLIWGYIQDEQHRLSVVRRNYEYDHQYGITLRGKAVEQFNPADSRSKYTAAFNHLLNATAHFFEQSNNTMIVPDAFPVLNALKELHFILSEGAHNQYGDLPSTARVEMLTQQWILAQQEFSQFLPTRASVAYPEAWMDRVSTMSALQGWNNPPILNFYHLARCGERILLSVRLGHWSDVTDSHQAANWAKFFREEIQQYIHSYRAVTGVDFSVKPAEGKIDATIPADLLAARRRG
ncbi:MAG TPA: hypothetical protein PK228_09140 [Saprospiraceae bacterium]|nr:hypothetical protein [Saprospiraceae bacterium]